ncbi:hypothetical protein [Actinomadura roseirufa]|uniref:hypothetical protein n=1 Tax=Actinomadura roseirufa TaxID=2094049 RepID=UPI0010410165|nr:hypothetical protein [Actinomadura roseirufa]
MSEDMAAGASAEIAGEIDAVLDRIRALTLASATGSLSTDDRQSNAEEYTELVSYLARKTQIGYRYIPAKLEAPHIDSPEAAAARQMILAAIQNELQAEVRNPEVLEQLALAYRRASDLFLLESNLYQEVRSLLLTAVTAQAAHLPPGESAPAIAQLARTYSLLTSVGRNAGARSFLPSGFEADHSVEFPLSRDETY